MPALARAVFWWFSDYSRASNRIARRRIKSGNFEFYEIFFRLECACSANYSVGYPVCADKNHSFSLPSACSRRIRMIEVRKEESLRLGVRNPWTRATNQWPDWVSLIINCVACTICAEPPKNRIIWLFIMAGVGAGFYDNRIKWIVNFCTWASLSLRFHLVSRRHRFCYRASAAGTTLVHICWSQTTSQTK